MPNPALIRTTRLSLGLTQQQAGELVGATARAWRAWESGFRVMPVSKWELFQIKTKGGDKVKTYAVLLKGDTAGEVRMETAPEIGDVVTVDLHDENGMPIKIKGKVVEILEEREY